MMVDPAKRLQTVCKWLERRYRMAVANEDPAVAIRLCEALFVAEYGAPREVMPELWVAFERRKFYSCKLCVNVSSASSNVIQHVERHHNAEMQAAMAAGQPTDQPAVPEVVVPIEAVPFEEPAEEPSEAPESADSPVGKSVMEMTVAELLKYITWLEEQDGVAEDLRERAETAELRAATAETRVLALEERIQRFREFIG